MGQRANLLFVDASGFELYYSHWCANTLPRDIFWGPDYAIRFIQIQQVVSDVGWLDSIWAEGGIVVDVEKQHLLFFGGEDILYDVPLRRFYLRMLQMTWVDWSIDWAYEGIVDIAEYVGVNRALVLADQSNDNVVINLEPPEERDWLQCVASFQLKSELRLFPLDRLPEDYLKAGPILINDCYKQKWYSKISIDEWTTEFPMGGFHIDIDLKTIHFWTTNDVPGVVDNVKAQWLGWKVIWEKDRFESQVEQTNGALNISVPNSETLTKCIQDILLTEHKPVDITEIANRISERDRGEIKINPLALRDDHLSLDGTKCRNIFQSALSKLELG